LSLDEVPPCTTVQTAQATVVDLGEAQAQPPTQQLTYQAALRATAHAPLSLSGFLA
jgi:hypothetical protein